MYTVHNTNVEGVEGCGGFLSLVIESQKTFFALYGNEKSLLTLHTLSFLTN